MNCLISLNTDVYPTSFGGKLVGTLAMLTGVLVIAFPVSVFSDLWSKELKKVGFVDIDDEDDINSQKSSFDADVKKQKHQTSSIALNQSPPRVKSDHETDLSIASENKIPSTFLGFGDRRKLEASLSTTNPNKSENPPNGRKRLHRRWNSDSLSSIPKSNSDVDDFFATKNEFKEKNLSKSEKNVSNDTTKINNYDLLGLDFLENSPLQQQCKSSSDVILSSQDIYILRRHLASIDESQKVIRRILGERSNASPVAIFS